MLRKHTFILVLVMVFSATVSAAQKASSLKHPKGEFVTVLGKKIWVETAGRGEPFLLIPGGGGGSHDYFHPYFDQLARSYRVVYYDGFGRGRSEHAKSPSEYSFEHDLDEIEALRQALHLRKIIVYGHSYGGFVAQGYALKYPGSVSKLIVSNIFTCAQDYQASDDFFNEQVRRFLPETWEKIAALRAQGLVASSPEMQQAYGQTDLMAMFGFYNPGRFKVIDFNELTFNPEEYYALIGPDADFTIAGDVGQLDFRPQLASIKVPFLVLAGRKDGIVLPSLAVSFKKYAPQARFVFFEHSGHFPFIEENREYVKTIEEFLNTSGK